MNPLQRIIFLFFCKIKFDSFILSQFYDFKEAPFIFTFVWLGQAATGDMLSLDNQHLPVMKRCSENSKFLL
jgi:hypothetical protein